MDVQNLILGGVGLLIAVIGFFIRKQFASYDKQFGHLNRTTVWIGDCLITIGAKSSIELPKRPEQG